MRDIKIALTAGDPAGIGPEIALRVAADPCWKAQHVQIILYGPEKVLQAAGKRFAPGEEVSICSTGKLSPEDFQMGEASAVCGRAALDAILTATDDALNHRVDAIVTAPVNKYAVNLAGVPFSGHTELIAERCHTKDFVMMQSAGALRMVFATTHIALSAVPETLTAGRIVIISRLLAEAVHADGVFPCRLACCALNPHAGENGMMGDEESRIIVPALEQLRKEGLVIDGPFPPDTIFLESIRSQYQGIVCMYHDQGHIPFKMLAFDRGVNSTLGLPIIRTSVDHGTAFEIAGKGIADSGSLIAAVKTAVCRARYVAEQNK